MFLRIRKQPKTWYFLTGIFTEHTQALYDPKENKLTIVRLKYLPQVIKHLQRELGIKEVTLEWFKEK